MILVDTSVVIDFARKAEPKLVSLFGSLPLAVCGIVRAEFLAGSRTPKERARNGTILDSLTQADLDESIWDQVGDNLAELRRQGVNIPFTDTVIATLAIAGDVELWTRDAHFAQVQRVLPALRLFAEPP